MKRQAPYRSDTTTLCEPSYLRLLLQLAAREGAVIDLLLDGSGLSWGELVQRDAPVDQEHVFHVVRACQRAVGRPTLALEAGLLVDSAVHGVLSALMASSANLRQGALALQAFLSTRTPTYQVTLEQARGGLLLKICSPCAAPDIHAFLLDYMAAVSSRLLRIVAGPMMGKVRLDLPWSEPGWSAVYTALAGSLRFRASQLAFWLPEAVLDAPNPTASLAHFTRAWREAEAQLGPRQGKLSLQGRIVALLHSTTGQHWPSADQVAARLGISRRTLVNHLQKEGTSYRSLVDTVRYERALWQLRHTTQPVAQIALSLGYQDVSNFSRAFRRWHGSAPQHVRREDSAAGIKISWP